MKTALLAWLVRTALEAMGDDEAAALGYRMALRASAEPPRSARPQTAVFVSEALAKHAARLDVFETSLTALEEKVRPLSDVESLSLRIREAENAHARVVDNQRNLFEQQRQLTIVVLKQASEIKGLADRAAVKAKGEAINNQLAALGEAQATTELRVAALQELVRGLSMMRHEHTTAEGSDPRGVVTTGGPVAPLSEAGRAANMIDRCSKCGVRLAAWVSPGFVCPKCSPERV